MNVSETGTWYIGNEAYLNETEAWIMRSFKKTISMVSCQKGPTRHVYAWQIGLFWQDTLDIKLSASLP